MHANTVGHGEGEFAAWRRLRPAVSSESLRLLGLTPFERPDISLARAFLRQKAAVAIDLGRDQTAWAGVFSFIRQLPPAAASLCGVRIPDHVAIAPEDLPDTLAFVILTAERSLSDWVRRYPVIVQVCSAGDADKALAEGAHGLIAKGQEAGGAVGEAGSYILLQSLLALTCGQTVPVWCQGGIGTHTVAGAIAGGAFGVVVDSQLALLAESGLPESVKADVRAMDGSETRLLGGYSVFSRPGSFAAELAADLAGEEVRTLLDPGRAQPLWPIGQDAALAKSMAAQCSNLESLLNTLRVSISGHVHQAVRLDLLGVGSPLAISHGTRYPVAQGPMTRVSDTAEFAAAVAENGGLPFLALSLMQESSARQLLDETRKMVAGRSWGVGVLGFAPPEVLNPHLALIQQYRPSVVLLAGGRPSQARALADQGIPAYLHVPSPGLLSLFLKDGARHFVFEGRECGGHVGPRFSFVLWEQQIQVLLGFERPDELHIMFAGGIHDERSAAMVAAIAAPLAARGAKIGVLMGSAYITTQEAVDCAAVNLNFQKRVIAGEETVLLETAPGHATRCLKSDFVEFFNNEKLRLQAEGQDQQSVWKQLEHLNVGRLRIATKGLRREGENLIEVDVHGQQAEGMYMIGQLVALRHAVNTISELHDSVSHGAMAWLRQCKLPALPRADLSEPVAVVGMACIYPGSPDLESYWANIVEGRNLVTEVPADRWSVDTYYQQGEAGKGKTPSKWGGFVDEIAFDPLHYGIPPQSLAAIEPAQLLSLEVANRALADAGYVEGGRYFDPEKTSVIFGAESGMDLSNAYAFRNLYAQYLGEMPAELDAVLPDLTEDSFPGVLVNVISGRIANRLGLGGVNYSVDAACASSLTAIEVAVKELRTGGSDMVLAGGADFHNSINDFLMFASVKALSPTGYCRSFDNSADGICLGEGVGVVVLKRLSDAERDGDRIYAVINGIAGSSDGKGLGLTAPRKEGQKRALERAYWQAGLLPGQVGLVEAHGTGTVVGDRTELQTLTEIFTAGGAMPLSVGLGSVKSQIGHTKCAAGIAGFIKVAKALHHKVLPPTLHIEKPNAGYDAVHSPFMLNRTAMPWLTSKAYGAISAFGFGGTNFHAVLSSFERAETPVTSGVIKWSEELFLFRGDSVESAARHMQQLSKFLRESDQTLSLRDIAYTVAEKWDGPVQCSIVARDVADLMFKLECAHLRESQEGVHYRQPEVTGKLAFLFPGQGSQSPGMLQDLFVAFPALHEILVQGQQWHDRMFPASAYTREQQQQQQRDITDTRVAQPTLGMANHAMATLLQSFNIQPDMLAGHSYGELVALSTAGCFDLAELLQLSARRGEVILAAAGDDPGRMAAVSEGSEILQDIFGPDSGVVLANQNSPAQTVISGASKAIEAALQALKARGIAARQIEVACAFHSPIVASAELAFRNALDEVVVRQPQIAVYSNTSASPYPSDVKAIKQQMAAQIVNPVCFVKQIEQMYADGARIFVEAGPGRVLTGLVQKILAGKPHVMISTDQKGQPGLRNLLEGVARLAVIVDHIDSAPLWAGRQLREIDLEHPCKLSATSWLINGARARPRHGDLPKHAGRPLLRPLQINPNNMPINGLNEPADQAVFHYLNNMRDMVQAQRDVMLTLLGSGGGAVARPMCVSSAHDGQRLIVGSNMDHQGVDTLVMSAPSPVVGVESHQNVRETLLAIVSERTGYPTDMLDPELDLEADLSIDSIKRVEIMGELAERMGLRRQLGSKADALLEQLAAQKTLHAVTTWLHDHLPGTNVHMMSAAKGGVEARLNMPLPARLDSQQALLSIVSQRTGYPEDALDLDLDLEADLSIDSIKRLEIVGELSSKLGLDSLLQDKDAALETLASLKTLRSIVEWLKTHAGGEAAGPEAEVFDTDIPIANTISSPGEDVSEGSGIPLVGLSKYVMKSVEAPDAIKGAPELSGKRFLITDDELGVASRLASRLDAHGAEVTVISFSEHAVMPDDLEHVDGLIHLFGLNQSARVRDVKRFFTLVRETLLHRASYLLVASGMGGNFGYFQEQGGQLPSDFGHGAGMAGMIKSVVKEWPEVKVHCVDLDLTESADELAAYLEIELLAENPLTEVGYRDGSRYLVKVVQSALPLTSEIDHLALDKESVILLTGGARGITAQLAVALARRYGCQLELIGRSPLPRGEESEATLTAPDLKSLRQVLVRNHPDLKPIEIEQQCSRILAAREIRQTFGDIEAAGGRVNYSAVDVRDIDAFGDFIEGLYRRHGCIDGVIHGAGVVEDKLLRHKTAESFQRVFDTKVRGALMIHKLIRDDVKFVVFFSSVAGAFGNRGQVDYASANDVLDKIAHALRARVKGRVLSVNWGPWAGTGMVSPELEREYARKGIGLIPVTEGVDALLQELQFGGKEDTQVVFMCATPESMDMAY
jgi:acyl transferase domain-containing protein/NAD(P)H-dependent flavin oxidoreductase YrpB (nitropropane dioxygenase family)/NAD(P)-dependent dehydrogenase (short-subunit alcohol dehydrogenase family)/acyl carrier protein